MSRSPPRAPWALRGHLSLLIAGALLPLLLFSGIVIVQLARERQRDIERRLLVSAHTMSGALEREIKDILAVLSGLSRSEHLASGELERFRRHAERVLLMHPGWVTVIVLDREGTQLLNLEVPAGAPARTVNDEQSFRRVLETGLPQLGSVERGRDGKTWGFPVRIPVMQEGEVRYVLTAVVAPRSLAEVLSNDGPGGDELTRTLVDAQGVVVFRGKSPEKFIGASATANFLEGIRDRSEGVFRSTTLEGEPSYVAFKRSPTNGWVGAVVVPRTLIEGPLRRSLWGLAIAGAVALLVSAAGAVLLSRRFRRGIQRLERAAGDLATGTPPRIEPTQIAELERVAESLARSATLLGEKTQALEHAVRSRDEFLSLASHELKTPLTSLALHTRIFERAIVTASSADRNATTRFLDQIRKQTGRLGRLIDDMLDISRIGSGKLTLERERFELVGFLAEVLERLTPMMTEAGCEVSLSATGPVWGTWDRFRLEQVVSNLLTNAARYGPGRPVSVSVTHHGEAASLRVRDQGRGIARADLERIFKRFERAVSANEVAGLGLGLFIVAEIVTMHGGTVHAESTLGDGATFVVTLPCPAEAVEPTERSA